MVRRKTTDRREEAIVRKEERLQEGGTCRAPVKSQGPDCQFAFEHPTGENASILWKRDPSFLEKTKGKEKERRNGGGGGGMTALIRGRAGWSVRESLLPTIFN